MTKPRRLSILLTTALAVLSAACGRSGDDRACATDDTCAPLPDEGGDDLTPPPPIGAAARPQLISASTYVVAPGDTVTFTGRALDSVVHRLVAVRIGAPEAPDDRFVVTASTTMEVTIAEGAQSGPVYLIDRIGQTGRTGQVKSDFELEVTR